MLLPPILSDEPQNFVLGSKYLEYTTKCLGHNERSRLTISCLLGLTLSVSALLSDGFGDDARINVKEALLVQIWILLMKMWHRFVDVFPTFNSTVLELLWFLDVEEFLGAPNIHLGVLFDLRSDVLDSELLE